MRAPWGNPLTTQSAPATWARMNAPWPMRNSRCMVSRDYLHVECQLFYFASYRYGSA